MSPKPTVTKSRIHNVMCYIIIDVLLVMGKADSTGIIISTYYYYGIMLVSTIIVIKSHCTVAILIYGFGY